MSERLYQCGWCKQYVGTIEAKQIHRTGTEAYPRCRTPRRMKELGMWQGMKGVWWTKDLGWDDDLGFFERASETRIEPSAQVPQKGLPVG